MMSNDDRDFTSNDRTGGNLRAASGKNGISPALIGFGIVAVLGLIFFFQNSDRVDIDLWVFDWNTTVRWSLLVAMFIGVLADRFFGMWWRRRARKKDDVKKSRA